ncbi:MAG TPA: ATP-binding protein [Pseudonocardia sp.]|jgi:anti-sigma regulatory factor (Ser/Thr protein kinase)|nr:ATP-binding protein [Pseudonocardia sp.]
MTHEALQQRLPVDTGAESRARRALRRWLDRWDWPRDEADDLVLATSEAVANSAEHAYPDGRAKPDIVLEATLRTEQDGTSRAVVTVSDGGRWQPPSADRGFRGRGLLLMRALTESVQFDTTGSGTQVTMVSHPVTAPAASGPLPRPRPARSDPSSLAQ